MLFLVFYIFGLVYLVLYAILMTESHPSFSKRDITSPAVWVFIVFVLVSFIVYIVYVICNLVHIFTIRHLLQWRHKIFLVFFVIFFIGTAILFFADAYNLYTYSASKVMITFCLMNFYSFFLQYLYSPTQDEIDKCARGVRKEIIVADADIANWQSQAGDPIELMESEELNSNLSSLSDDSKDMNRRAESLK